MQEPLTTRTKYTLSRHIILPILLLLALAALRPAATRAQYTDWQAITDHGGPQSFTARRAQLAKTLSSAQNAKPGFILLFARNEIPEATHYREDNDFYYFTGLQDPGAVLLLDQKTGNAILFEPAQAPRTAQVYGPNLMSLPTVDRAPFGYSRVLPVSDLDTILSTSLQSNPGCDLWIRLGFPDKADGARQEVGRDHAWKFAHPYHPPLPDDLVPAKELTDRYPMANLRDLTQAIDDMRNIKTPEEIAILRRLGKISAAGDKDAIAHAHPPMYQYQIEARATFYFADHGAQSVAYPAIVGSGNDINTWHYFSNRHKIEANDLVVFDYGASLDHETMDITRTFNISGKFTPEQAKWYKVDLDCQKAVIALLTPGHTYEEADAAGKAVFEAAGIADQWYGFPGHFVGLATHDVKHATGPIKAGQVITVEPIVEFPDKHQHYRVEDTILITNGAPENLSADIPKEQIDVEKLVGSAQ